MVKNITKEFLAFFLSKNIFLIKLFYRGIQNNYYSQ